MYNIEIRQKLQIGVLQDLYKRELITKKELDKCIKILQKENEKNGTEKSSSILQG